MNLYRDNDNNHYMISYLYKKELYSHLFNDIPGKIIYNTENMENLNNIEYNKRLILHKKNDINTKCQNNQPIISLSLIMDGCNIINDFYSNIIDWDKKDNLYVQVSNSLYYRLDQGDIGKLYEFNKIKYSLKHLDNFNVIAIGGEKNLKIIDTEYGKIVRSLPDILSRIISIDDNNFTLLYGTYHGLIYHYDIREKNHSFYSNSNENIICNIKFSYDKRYFAFGTNNNNVIINDIRKNSIYTILKRHEGAVKALSWSPTNNNQIITGGGSNDRRIILWDINNPSIINEKVTKSQLCSLIWLQNINSIISSHGFTHHSINIWNSKNLAKKQEIKEHHNTRILHMLNSRNEQYVASVSPDDTVVIWKVNRNQILKCRKNKKRNSDFKIKSCHKLIR